MSHLELPCADCGHKLVAVSAKGLSDAVAEHKRYHRWLDHQPKETWSAGMRAWDSMIWWPPDEPQ